MRIIEPYFEILSSTYMPLQLIEQAGRVCYKSEDKITPISAPPFVNKIAKTLKHESVLEHASMTVRFICDRGVSHELVRHRLASFSQESTRYCNYSNGKHGSEITVIRPCFWEVGSPLYSEWARACEFSEMKYLQLLNDGASPQEARSVLPNSLKTEIVVTANFREWKHIFKLRCAPNAHPQMRQLMIPLRDEMAKHFWEVFGE